MANDLMNCEGMLFCIAFCIAFTRINQGDTALIYRHGLELWLVHSTTVIIVAIYGLWLVACELWLVV